VDQVSADDISGFAYCFRHIKQAGQAKVGSPVRVISLSSEFARLRDIVGIAGDNPPTLHEVRSLAARLYTERHGKAFANALLGHKSAQMTELYLDERDGWFRPKMTG
jgi:integrase